MPHLEINNLVKGRYKKTRLEKVAHEVLKVTRAKTKEFSLAIVNAKTIRHLNKCYRGVDKVTDVLAFEDPPEIIISYPQAKKQAQEEGHPIQKELEILLTHGLLHILGYSHKAMKQFKGVHSLVCKFTD